MNKELKKVVREMQKVCDKYIHINGFDTYGCSVCPLDRKPFCLKNMVINNDYYNVNQERLERESKNE